MISKEKRELTFTAAVIAIAAFMATRLPWEIGGESWGYWYFAKQLVHGDGFVTPARSPLYTAYLMPFLLIPSLISTVVESFVSTCVSALSVYFLLRWRIGNSLAALFSILWIPFFQQSEPANQTLGLACVCLAFGIRLRSSGASTVRLIRISYMLVVAATLFRPNYGVYLFLLFAYDLWVLRRGDLSTMEAFVSFLKIIKSWLFLFTFALIVMVSSLQSSNRWNNVWFASTNWLPGNAQSLSTASVIGHYNWRYIQSKYGSFEGKDIYFTHTEAFGGATSVAGMIQANTLLFANIVAKNVKDFFVIASFNFVLPSIQTPHAGGVLSLLAFLGMCWGAIKAAHNKLLLVYVGGSLLVVFLTSMSLPKVRYMAPLVPVFALSAWWYGAKLGAYVRGVGWPALFNGVAIVLMFLFSAAPIVQWLKFFKPTVSTRSAEIEPRTISSSMKTAFPELKRHILGCHGIISMEHMFFGAFIIDQTKVLNVDIWEIPPFGSYGSSTYKGLTIERINCLFISSSLEYETGMGTNNQIRYQNYIKPYAEHLVSMGASNYLIPGYGRVIKLIPVEVSD